MPYGVDPAMQLVKAARHGSPLHLPPAYLQSQELPERHDPVLLRRQESDQLINALHVYHPFGGKGEECWFFAP